jgi:hypothetical protein
MKFQFAASILLGSLTPAHAGSLRQANRQREMATGVCPEGSNEILVDFSGFEAGQYVDIINDFLQVTAIKTPNDEVSQDLGYDSNRKAGFTPIRLSDGKLVNNVAGGMARIFDSSNPTGGDDDLGSPNETCQPSGGPGKGEGGEVGKNGENCAALNKLLFIQEDNLGISGDPNAMEPDDAVGGTLAFNFLDNNNMYSLLKIGVIDVDETSVALDLFNGGDTTATDGGLGDNAFQEIVSPNPDSFLHAFDIKLKGSGAVAYLKLCEKVTTDPNIDIEKLVRINKVDEQGDLCDVANKPIELSFTYVKSNAISNNQDGKAKFPTNVNGLDNDCDSYVIVSEKDKVADALQEEAKIYFKGKVSCDDAFTATKLGGGDFPGSLYIYFFSNPDAPSPSNLVQHIRFESGCGKAIMLGDVFGSATVTCYKGKDDTNTETCLAATDPDEDDDDADEPKGPQACPGDTAIFTSIVTNTGDVPLCDIQVTTSDSLETEEDPTYVRGDENKDNCLDLTEKWIYVQSDLVTAPNRILTGEDTVFGTASDGRTVTDSDPVHYFVECPSYTGDICDTCGKPTFMTWNYLPLALKASENNSQQGSKSSLTGIADTDGDSYIVVADAQNVVQGGGNTIYFQGSVKDGETFQISTGVSGVDKFVNEPYFHAFDSKDDFDNGKAALQIAGYHMSCSAAIVFGAQIGSFVLVPRYEGEDCTYEY